MHLVVALDTVLPLQFHSQRRPGNAAGKIFLDLPAVVVYMCKLGVPLLNLIE